MTERYINSSSANIWTTASGTGIPALFVYGDQDIRPSWPVEQLAELMPNAQYANIEGAHHYIWFTHANVLKQFLRRFIDGIDARV